jgi:hypothetical protein
MSRTVPANDNDDDDRNFPSIADIPSDMERKRTMTKGDLSPKNMSTEQLVDNGSLEDVF